MNRHAILHFPDIPYAYPAGKDSLSLRLRVARGDRAEVRVRYKDRYDWKGKFREKAMAHFAEDSLFEWFECKISLPGNRYRYYFEITDRKGERLLLDERGLQDTGENMEAAAFQYAYIGESDVYRESGWLQRSVAYQIFPDRFENGDEGNDPPGTLRWGMKPTTKSMFGGDLKGITGRLDHIKKLGADLIYMTPIFASSSNHKYNTRDYYEVDKSFGSLEDVRELIDRCHNLGIRVIFDAVFNHSGSDFFAFSDILEKQEDSGYANWYHLEGFPVSTDKVNYHTFADNIPSMPKFNISNPAVREYLLEVGKYWVKEMGIDGWRLDVCDEVDHSFWKEFRKAVKSVNPDAVIIGEIMHEASSFLKGDELDSIMNYPFKGACVDFFAKRAIDAGRFSGILASSRAMYMEGINHQMWNLLGSHDTQRFLTEAFEDKKRLMLAAAFQFLYIGVPYIYYGDEIGMSGGKDPLCRGCMVWDEERQDRELLGFFRKLISIRKGNPALVSGDLRMEHARGGLVAFSRSYGDERILAVFNNSDSRRTLRKGIPSKVADLYTGETRQITDGVTIEPMGFLALRVLED
ncbi:glycoside hydrolase family 13 protein [Youngiibacter fragilis]|uniref:Cyclomaltodextrinase n=1 Tax=Youngiibacter fragilis 232.1 TaxID=994573 RepID=V7I4H0_9CLOT|nr:glycoside hydrolase family 13 protein [Youngiibacter fragilis]ETA79892.1 cyclomaltodextrinase [Youngiibacter fragilis 232.1]